MHFEIQRSPDPVTPYPIGDDEILSERQRGGGGSSGGRDMLHTSCGHWIEDAGFESGCEHFECALQSLCYGIVPWSDGDGFVVIKIVVAVVALIFCFPFGVLLIICLIVFSFLKDIYYDVFEKSKIRRELEEFKKFGTIGGVKAVQLFHHNPQCQHVVSSDSPLEKRLKYREYLTEPPAKPPYIVTTRIITNPNDEFFRDRNKVKGTNTRKKTKATDRKTASAKK